MKNCKLLLVTLLLTACGTNVSKTGSYPMVATGQVAFYDNAGNVIDAPVQGDAFYGQDATYLSGAEMSFTDNGDGIIIDENTGLMWQQIPVPEGMTWAQAKEYCESLELGGYSDWRLPSAKELFSISNFSEGWPYIDTNYFSLATGISKDEQYWTSHLYVGETVEGGSDAAFGVNHVTGHIKAYPSGNNMGSRGSQQGQGAQQEGERGERPQQGAQGEGERGERPQQGAQGEGERGERPQQGAQGEGERGERPQQGAQGEGERGERPQQGAQGERPAREEGNNQRGDMPQNDRRENSTPPQSTADNKGISGYGSERGNGGTPPSQAGMGERGGSFNPMAKQVRAVRGEAYGINNFKDNGDGTISDSATGLMWAKEDNGKGIVWGEALTYAEGATLAGHDDWRLPNVKELQSIVSYDYAPSSKGGSAAIDPIFECTPFVNEAGDDDFGYYWSGTSACFTKGRPFYFAWYVAFGRAVNNAGLDFHGAGAVRFDSKSDNGTVVEGGEERYYNFVRLVRSID